MESPDPDMVCLSFGELENQIKSSLKKLQLEKDFCDVTIACEDCQIEAHKVILAEGSLIFRNILKKGRPAYPLIILSDVKFSHLLGILDFMYQGKVHIDQGELYNFLSVARDLQINGLTEDAIKDLKQSENYVDKCLEGDNKKKQQLSSSHGVYLKIEVDKLDGRHSPAKDLEDDELEEDFDDFKELEHLILHFAEKGNDKKKQGLVNSLKPEIHFDYDIKIEIGDNEAYIQEYVTEESNTEQDKEKSLIQPHANSAIKKGGNIGGRRLGISDVAKLSENTSQTQSFPIIEDVSQKNSNRSNVKVLSKNDVICEQCKKIFTHKTYLGRRNALKKHIFVAHTGGALLYSCDKCDYIANDLDRFRAHKESSHKTI